MKNKKLLCLALCLTLLTLGACGAKEPAAQPEASAPQTTEQAGTTVLIAYFSCTGNTKRLAEYVAAITWGDLYEIAPAVPYTADDLDYDNPDCRAAKEKADSAARPEIAGEKKSVEGYDTVFLAYPIWFGQAPKIISTFLESGDFSGKTIVPFCTSGSSGVGASATQLHACCSERTSWLAGTRLAADLTPAQAVEWVNSLGLVFETE